MQFIIKLSSESFIKSRSVRSWHISQLQRNIAKVLSQIDRRVKVSPRNDRIEIECGAEYVTACQQRLGDIPGIHSILTVDSCGFPEHNPLDYIAEQAVSRYVDAIENKSFVVRCRRSGKHGFRSVDAERHIGAALLQHSVNSRVQLKQADLTINIEIIDDQVHFVRDKLAGTGGFPLGTQGTVLSLLSGGFDSSVASYQMMRRGCRVHYLFFNLSGSPAHALGVQQAALYLWQKFGSTQKARFHSVSLEPFVNALMQLPDPGLNGVLLKRAMLRVADMVARKHKITTLVTGESLGQVSSQTLHNLAVIEKGAEHLVLRPLITADKADIIATAEKIGSAIFARNMVEYCGVISNKPTVAASLQTLEQLEREIGDDWFQAALNSAHNVPVAELIEYINAQPAIEVMGDTDGRLLIDIRATASPLEQADLHIPFFNLNQKFPVLDQSQEYLLYCDKGVMSQLHAAYLQEQGFMNVKVYRPLD